MHKGSKVKRKFVNYQIEIIFQPNPNVLEFRLRQDKKCGHIYYYNNILNDVKIKKQS